MDHRLHGVVHPIAEIGKGDELLDLRFHGQAGNRVQLILDGFEADDLAAIGGLAGDQRAVENVCRRRRLKRSAIRHGEAQGDEPGFESAYRCGRDAAPFEHRVDLLAPVGADEFVERLAILEKQDLRLGKERAHRRAQVPDFRHLDGKAVGGVEIGVDPFGKLGHALVGDMDRAEKMGGRNALLLDPPIDPFASRDLRGLFADDALLLRRQTGGEIDAAGRTVFLLSPRLDRYDGEKKGRDEDERNGEGQSIEPIGPSLIVESTDRKD